MDHTLYQIASLSYKACPGNLAFPATWSSKWKDFHIFEHMNISLPSWHSLKTTEMSTLSLQPSLNHLNTNNENPQPKCSLLHAFFLDTLPMHRCLWRLHRHFNFQPKAKVKSKRSTSDLTPLPHLLAHPVFPFLSISNVLAKHCICRSALALSHECFGVVRWAFLRVLFAYKSISFFVPAPALK